MLETFPLSIKTIPFFLHISTIFSLTFLITLYGSLLLKAILEKKGSITPKDLHLLTISTKFDTRSSVLLGDLLFSRSFTSTCNIALSQKPVSNVGSIKCNISLPLQPGKDLNLA